MVKSLLIYLLSMKGHSPAMPDIPLHLFRKYIRTIKTQHGWDYTEIARKSGLPNTTITRPMRENYEGQGVRAATVNAIRKGTKVPPPDEIAELLGEAMPAEVDDLQLAIEIADRITSGRFSGLDSATKAEIVKDVLSALQEAGRKAR
jgi:transcriptional regulator with XRE-family HTH domain